MKSWSCIVFVVAGLFLGAVPAGAHHGRRDRRREEWRPTESPYRVADVVEE